MILYLTSYPNTYWAKERSLYEIKKSIENSVCFGAYLDGKQIGFARVITDKTIFSYLLDVFIDEKYQGKNYGQFFLKEIYNHPHLIQVKKHYLHTKDAQRFYEKFGFETYPNPKRFMIKTN
ncbi:MAG: GNAT family N-acetyltransferase [Flavobacteriaceae bacterium]